MKCSKYPTPLLKSTTAFTGTSACAALAGCATGSAGWAMVKGEYSDKTAARVAVEMIAHDKDRVMVLPL